MRVNSFLATRKFHFVFEVSGLLSLIFNVLSHIL